MAVEKNGLPLFPWRAGRALPRSDSASARGSHARTAFSSAAHETSIVQRHSSRLSSRKSVARHSEAAHRHKERGVHWPFKKQPALEPQHTVEGQHGKSAFGQLVQSA